jgi:hypothetical protein
VCHALLQDPRFFAVLLQIDREQAAQTQAAGCTCAGRLHRANYPRKPRGCLPEFRSSFDHRFSFCCSACRKRTTATSVRFLGRRVYLALVVVLSSSRHAGSNSAAPLLAGLAVARRTLERWRLWWRGAFMQTPLWLGACGAFMPPLDTEHLPAVLLERFIGADALSRMSALLRFLTPLTVRARSMQPTT